MSIKSQPISSENWSILYSHNDTNKNKVSEIEKNRITSLFDKHLKEKGSLNLSRFSMRVLENSQYSKIHALLFSSNKILISLSKHTPILKLVADATKCVSSEGIVYGSCHDEDFPELHGMLKKPLSSYKKRNNNEVVLSKMETSTIKDSINLYELAREENIELSLIEHKKYRGIFAKIQNTETIVSFGSPPFKGKVKKLRKIIYSLSSKGKAASRIELDFENKAFIKENTI